MMAYLTKNLIIKRVRRAEMAVEFLIPTLILGLTLVLSYLAKQNLKDMFTKVNPLNNTE
jgi:hypothetical protein